MDSQRRILRAAEKGTFVCGSATPMVGRRGRNRDWFAEAARTGRASFLSVETQVACATRIDRKARDAILVAHKPELNPARRERILNCWRQLDIRTAAATHDELPAVDFQRVGRLELRTEIGAGEWREVGRGWCPC